MSGTLSIHAGGQIRTRDELRAIVTPTATKTFRPIPHIDLVEGLAEALECQGFSIRREQWATMGRQDARLFGVIDLVAPGFDSPDLAFSMGIRTANDMSMALRAMSGANVFVCDNMAFSGDGVTFRRKHTSGLRLAPALSDMVDAYAAKTQKWVENIEIMKEIDLSDRAAESIIYDACVKHAALPIRLARRVHELYFEDRKQQEMHPDETLWGLNNSFTEAVKTLRPARQHHYGDRVGRFFLKHLRRIVAARQVVGVN